MYHPQDLFDRRYPSRRFGLTLSSSDDSRHNTFHCNGTDDDIIYYRMLASNITCCFFDRELGV